MNRFRNGWALAALGLSLLTACGTRVETARTADRANDSMDNTGSLETKMQSASPLSAAAALEPGPANPNFSGTVTFTPAGGGAPIEREVFKAPGPGISLSMYNLD